MWRVEKVSWSLLIVTVAVSKIMGLLYGWVSDFGCVVVYTADIMWWDLWYGLWVQWITSLHYRWKHGSGMWDYWHWVSTYVAPCLIYKTNSNNVYFWGLGHQNRWVGLVQVVWSGIFVVIAIKMFGELISKVLQSRMSSDIEIYCWYLVSYPKIHHYHGSQPL